MRLDSSPLQPALAQRITRVSRVVLIGLAPAAGSVRAQSLTRTSVEDASAQDSDASEAERIIVTRGNVSQKTVVCDTARTFMVTG